MERRINKKIELYVTEFKNKIKTFINSKDEFPYKNEFINYINGCERLELKKEDFMKRKRVKNIVPYYDRCNAKKANKTQCTRRKLKTYTFCGTHYKSQPYGIIELNKTEPKIKKVTVWAQDVHGIIYYMDDSNNVYNPADIINDRRNPKIIAKYECIGGVYSIPAFNI